MGSRGNPASDGRPAIPRGSGGPSRTAAIDTHVLGPIDVDGRMPIIVHAHVSAERSAVKGVGRPAWHDTAAMRESERHERRNGRATEVREGATVKSPQLCARARDGERPVSIKLVGLFTILLVSCLVVSSLPMEKGYAQVGLPPIIDPSGRSGLPPPVQQEKPLQPEQSPTDFSFRLNRFPANLKKKVLFCESSQNTFTLWAVRYCRSRR